MDIYATFKKRKKKKTQMGVLQSKNINPSIIYHLCMVVGVWSLFLLTNPIQGQPENIRQKYPYTKLHHKYSDIKPQLSVG